MVAGGSRPGRAALAISPVMARLSTYMADAGGRPLPEAVEEKAGLNILGTLGGRCQVVG